MYQEKQWPEVGTLGYSGLDGTWGGQMVLDADAECTRIEVVLKPTRSRSIADSPELLEKHVMRHFIEGGTDDPGSLSIALLPLTVCWDAGISGLIPFALLALAIWSANVSASDTGRLLVMLIAPVPFALFALINPQGADPAASAEVTGCALSALV